MKWFRTFIALAVMGLWVTTGMAQVAFDFEDEALGTQGFADNGWGPALTSVAWAADPTGMSTGVLALGIDGSKDKGVIQVDGWDPGEAAVISYMLYLPAGFPDGVNFSLWGQDNQNWGWCEGNVYVSTDLPKDTWVPISFLIQYKSIVQANFKPYGDNKFGKAGLQIYLGTNGAGYTGSIYVDDITLIGVEPDVAFGFEDEALGTQGFADNGWGPALTSVAWAADPTGTSAGVLALGIDGSKDKGVIQVDGWDPGEADVISYMLYLPAGFPDGVNFSLWGQDNQNWGWCESTVLVSTDLPKDTWVPVSFEIRYKSIVQANFKPYGDNKFGKAGLQIYLGTNGAGYTGTLYVDDISLLGAEVGEKWVYADFENQVLGTAGFENNNWGPSLIGVSWLADPTGAGKALAKITSAGVLNTDWDFTLGTKGSFSNGNIIIYSEELEKSASKITMDVYLPADMPLGAQVSIFAQDHVGWTFTEDPFMIDDSVLVRGQWNTLTYDIDEHAAAGEVDPTSVLSVGCQIYYATAETWTGSVYWDNFTVWGIPEPVGDIFSPLVTAEIDTASSAIPPYYYVTINWVDNTAGTETYNVYMSGSPITDVGADGVIRLTDKIPHGEEYWVHRPWSSDGSEMTFYYAVTAVKPDGTETELTEDCKAGPVTLPTSVTAKAVYDAEFASKFSLDGLDLEFQEYAAYKLVPEGAGGDQSAGWTVASTDMTWSTTFVFDADYLYISADVTDDDLNALGNEPAMEGTQPWMGDALEFYIGYYNVNLLGDYHKYNDVDLAGTGDWRIAFTAWGTTGTATVNDMSFPGVETTVYQKFAGDGYIIEARIALDSLALNNDIQVVNGARLPMQITGNDIDPSNGDTGRTLQANWGGQSGPEVWKRPGGWGFLEVEGGPADVADRDRTFPYRFHLSENYPNPFNPATRLSYELARTSDVTITVYDLLGNAVKTLVRGRYQAGSHTVEWDGTNEASQKVASGIYFCKMMASGYSRTIKMMLVK